MLANARPSRPRRLLRGGRAAPPAGAARQAAGGGRRPARPRRRRRRRATRRASYGIRSAMSCAEALRRCPHVVFVRPDHRSLPRVVAAGLGRWCASRRRWSSRSASTRATWCWPTATRREQAALVQQAIRDAGAAVGVAGRRRRARWSCKIASDMRKPGGITVRARRRGGGVPGAARGAPAAGGGAEGRAAAGGARHRDDRRAGRARRRPHARSCCPGAAGWSCATAPAGSTRGRCHRRAGRGDLDLERGDVRRRHRATARSCTRGCARWRRRWRRRCSASGRSARTVTTKLRYPDFSIVTRSHSLAVGTDDADADRRAGLHAARPRARSAARARCGWWAWACPGFERAPAADARPVGRTRRAADGASYAADRLRSSRCWCDGQYSRLGQRRALARLALAGRRLAAGDALAAALDLLEDVA